jgi:DNA polymerase III delta prime subunit
MSQVFPQELFTEKFRPKNLQTIILLPRIREEVNKGLIQNLLFFGTQGTGKTSLMRILSDGHPSLLINASSERGIEVVRERFSRFASTISLEDGRDKLKCIMMEEFEGATPEFMDALKAVMEKYAHLVRFIATTNHVQKVPPEMQSRFNYQSFDPINTEEEQYLVTEYKKRISLILKAAKITFDDTILTKFVMNDFPDLRSLMNKIQSFYLRGITELNPKNFNINYDYVDMFNICLQKPDKPYEIYKNVISEYSTRVDEALSVLHSDFPEYLRNNVPNKINKLPLIIITTAKYQYQKSFVIDPIVCLEALIFELQSILNS